MKRIIFLTALLGAVMFGLASPAFSQSSVPNVINFQGKLTDNAGNPVADGTHSFVFRIYDGDVTQPGATLLWTEGGGGGGPVLLTTSGGLFNHQLGSIADLPANLFQDYDSLYLEIQADDEILAPRTRLISNPYTRAANVSLALTCNGCVTASEIANDAVVGGLGGDIADGSITAPDLGTNSVGSDEIAPNAVVGGLGGDILDGSITLDDLGTNSVASDEIAPQSVGTGDIADGSINRDKLADEPGVASNTNPGGVIINLDGTVQTLLSRNITVPASGYVLVIGTVQATISHTSGTSSAVEFGVSDAAGSFPPNQEFLLNIPSSFPTALSLNIPISVHGLFSVAAGANTFYFLGQEFSAPVVVTDMQLTLIYFPTSYGMVVPTVAGSGENTFDDKAAGRPIMTNADAAGEQPATKFSAEQIAQELAQVRSEMEALKKEVREQRNQSRQGIENEN